MPPEPLAMPEPGPEPRESLPDEGRFVPSERLVRLVEGANSERAVKTLDHSKAPPEFHEPLPIEEQIAEEVEATLANLARRSAAHGQDHVMLTPGGRLSPELAMAMLSSTPMVMAAPSRGAVVEQLHVDLVRAAELGFPRFWGQLMVKGHQLEMSIHRDQALSAPTLF